MKCVKALDGKVLKIEDAEADRLVKEKSHTYITKQEYWDIENAREPSFTIGSLRKRIYGEVSPEDFKLFNDRCKAEKIEMGQAFAELVRQYAHGAKLVAPIKRDEKKKKTGVDYLSQQ